MHLDGGPGSFHRIADIGNEPTIPPGPVLHLECQTQCSVDPSHSEERVGRGMASYPGARSERNGHPSLECV